MKNRGMHQSYFYCSGVWNTGTSTKVSSGTAKKPALLKERKNPLSANGNFPAALGRVWLRARATNRVVIQSYSSSYATCGAPFHALFHMYVPYL